MEPYNKEQSGNLLVIDFLIYIKKIFNLCLNNWKFICFVSIVSATLFVGYAYLQSPKYTASLTFALEEDKSSGGGLSGALGIASSLGIDLGSSAGSAFSSNNLIELMKSRRIVEQTLLKEILINGKKNNLAEYYIKFNKIRDKWQDIQNIRNVSFFPIEDRSKFSRPKDSILGKIYNSIITNDLNVYQRDKKVSIINIDVSTEDELFCKLFCEQLASEVSNFYIDTKSKKAKINVSILEKQTDSIRSELNQAITGVASANDNTYNLNPAQNVRRVPSIKKQVDVQANTAILTQLVTNLELAKVALRRETPLIQIIDFPIMPLKKERVSRLKMLIVGGIVGGLLSVLSLLVSYWWKNNMNNIQKF